MITKDMNIQEIVSKHPETIQVLQSMGLGCIGCIAASGESLKQGINAHGLNVDEVVSKLNKAIETSSQTKQE